MSKAFGFLRRHVSERRDRRLHDGAIRDWGIYDSGVQDIGKALYVAETMIHMSINEGLNPSTAVTTYLNAVRDQFSIPYAKGDRRAPIS